MSILRQAFFLFLSVCIHFLILKDQIIFYQESHFFVNFNTLQIIEDGHSSSVLAGAKKSKTVRNILVERFEFDGNKEFNDCSAGTFNQKSCLRLEAPRKKDSSVKFTRNSHLYGRYIFHGKLNYLSCLLIMSVPVAVDTVIETEAVYEKVNYANRQEFQL